MPAALYAGCMSQPHDAQSGAVPHMSPDEFRRVGREVVEIIAQYYETIESRPVLSRVEPGEILAQLPGEPPEHGESWPAILADIERVVMPGLTHWQSPRFFGYFPASASFPAILADLLCSGLCVQGMLWQTSPACTEVEMRVLDWLGRAIGLPDEFLFAHPNGGGVIQGTASEASLAAMIAARHRAVSAGADPASLCAYASSQAHSSIAKDARILGLDERRLGLIGVDASLAMRPDELERRMRADRAAGLTPFFVCATLGTTSSAAVDPLEEIGIIAQRERAWLHVDAAYAGSALLCPEHRWMARGVERADSFNFNPHKWMLVNFDCSAFWTRDRSSLIGALSIMPEYLRNRASERGAIDYRDWQIPLGRRFRALKLWFVMRHYGLEGLRAHIRSHVRLAEVFESWVREDDRFVMDVERRLSLVCFRLRAGDDATHALLERINQSGRAFLIHSSIPVGPSGEPRIVLRMAIGAPGAAESHIREAWEVIRREAGVVLGG